MNNHSIIRRVFAILLVLAAGIAVAAGYLVPIHKYGWSDDPIMARQVDPDAVLFIVFVSGMGLVLAGAGAALFGFGAGWRRLAAAVGIVLALLAAYRLSMAIMLQN